MSYSKNVFLSMLLSGSLGLTLSACTDEEVITKEPSAQQLLEEGKKLSQGQGVPKDASRAAQLISRAALLGSTEAQRLLGHMYSKGDGVGQDLIRAAEWFAEAGNHGDTESQYILGNMYVTGRGMPKDERQAVEWLKKAADSNYVPALLKLGELYDEGILVNALAYASVASCNGVFQLSVPVS